MKTFSRSWISSKKPKKQRKYRAHAPYHLKHHFLSVNLSESLREKYKRRHFTVRKGDTVKIMRGQFKGKIGKVHTVKRNTEQILVEGIQVPKRDGTKAFRPIHPSNLQITELMLDDKFRKQSIMVTTQEKK